ncbi:MAG: hypothetical protein CME06_03755 [Gemmatimonadetes bacterium]|nr:hypothetical protein [Gemmatimonadota bacterium]
MKSHAVVGLEPAADARGIQPRLAQLPIAPAPSGIGLDLFQKSAQPIRRPPRRFASPQVRRFGRRGATGRAWIGATVIG